MALSLLTGQDHAAQGTQLADEPAVDPSLGEVSFQEAVDFLKSRIPVDRDQWAELDAQLRFRAFAVNRLTDMRAIDGVKERLVKALESGQTMNQVLSDEGFKALVGDQFGARYWEIVYRTNVQTAYNAGRALQFGASGVEYLEFIGLEDERQTDICRERSNTILPAGDPWWASNWPPLHYNCRSTVRAVSKTEALARGLSDKKDVDQAVSTARGFGGNPVDTGSFYKLTPGMLREAEDFGLKDELASMAKALGLAADPVATSRLIVGGSWVDAKGGVLSAEAKATLMSDAEKKLKSLRGSTHLQVPGLGPVTFSNVGNEHLFSFTADSAKVEMLEKIQEWLPRLRGTIVPLSKPKPGYLEAFDGRIALTVEGLSRQYKVTILKRGDGAWIVYDLQEFKMR